MDYWWEATRYGHDPLLLNPAEAAAILQAPAGKLVWIPRLKVRIDPAKWELEETGRLVESDDLRLGDGGVTAPIDRPLPGSFDNSVKVGWVKKRVNHRSWEKEYAGRPGYYRLHADNNSADVWLAFLRPVYKSGFLPNGLEELEEWELEIVERRLSRSISR